MSQLTEVRFEATPPEAMVEHEYAKLFPMLDDAARVRLIADIRENGVIEPIVFLGPAILDGRNRYFAARELGIAYPRVDYLGSDPLGFVISRNLHRRHLSDQKRASIAADIAKLPRGRPSEIPSIEGIIPSQEDAAKLLSVSVSAVERAAAVKSHGVPELIAVMESEAVSLSAAAEVAALPAEVQVAVVAAGPEAIKEKAKDQRDARKAARAEEQAKNDEFQAKSKAALPPAVQAAEAAKAEAISARKTRGASDALSAEIDELREALTAVETENVALKQDIRRFDDMRVQWEQGGFEAVIAGKDEEIRVLKTRVERESDDKVKWMRSAEFWKKEAISRGYSRNAVLDLETGEFVNG